MLLYVHRNTNYDTYTTEKRSATVRGPCTNQEKYITRELDIINMRLVAQIFSWQLFLFVCLFGWLVYSFLRGDRPVCPVSAGVIVYKVDNANISTAPNKVHDLKYEIVHLTIILLGYFVQNFGRYLQNMFDNFLASICYLSRVT